MDQTFETKDKILTREESAFKISFTMEQIKDFNKAWRTFRWGKIIDHSLINLRFFDFGI